MATQPNPAIAGLSGGAAPLATPADQPASTAPPQAPAAPAAPQAEPEPHESVARHILDALGGGAPGPMSWAKSIIAGGLAGAANVGKVPEGAGALAGAARGAQGYQEQQRQQALDAQAKQKQQFEQQEKLKADELAQKQDTRADKENAALTAWQNAQTAHSTMAEQRESTEFSERRAELAQQALSHFKAADLDLSQYPEIRNISDLNPMQKQQLLDHKVLAINNGGTPKPGEEDDVGFHLVPVEEVRNARFKTDQEIPNGLDENGKPQYKKVSAGTTLWDAQLALTNTQEQLNTLQKNQKEQAAVEEAQNKAKLSGVEAAHGEANESLKEAETRAKIGETKAETEKALLGSKLLQKQMEDPDSLTPKEVHELQKSGQGESSKAQKDYNTFLQSANSIEGSIRASRNGNELAAAIIPLQGTLFITTAEGVKRINETELAGVQGAGDIARRGQNAYQKFINGDTSEGTKRDLANLIEVYKKAKYQQYLNNEDVTAKNYRLGDKQSVFDINGKPTTLGDARKKVADENAPTAKGDAAKVHANMADFTHHYTGAKGEIFSDDGKTWYDAQGALVGGK